MAIQKRKKTSYKRGQREGRVKGSDQRKLHSPSKLLCQGSLRPQSSWWHSWRLRCAECPSWAAFLISPLLSRGQVGWGCPSSGGASFPKTNGIWVKKVEGAPRLPITSTRTSEPSPLCERPVLWLRSPPRSFGISRPTPREQAHQWKSPAQTSTCCTKILCLGFVLLHLHN